MTTAPVHTEFVLDLCDRAMEKIISKIKKCPVSRPPEVCSHDMFPDPEEFFAYETLKDWCKDLNFVVRLKELCKMAQGSSTCIDLSLDTYTKLTIWAGRAIIYSPDNPIP